MHSFLKYLLLAVIGVLFSAPLQGQTALSLDEILQRHEVKNSTTAQYQTRKANVLQTIGTRVSRSISKVASWLQRNGMTDLARLVNRLADFLSRLLRGLDGASGSTIARPGTPTPRPASRPTPSPVPSSPEVSSPDTTAPSHSPTENPPATGRTLRFKAWGWVNEKPSIETLVNCDKDLLVLDQDDYDEGEITRIKAGGRRTVISYLSVGEVEKYRSHYDAARNLICQNGENEDWPDNFKIQYWNPRWLEILKPVVDEIDGKGFQGFYFDVVDAWEAGFGTKVQMTEFLIKLCTYIRSRNPQALIFFQNSHRLFDDAKLAGLMSGMNQEGLYCNWNPDYTIKGAEREEKIACFKRLLAKGKWIGLIEYTRDPDEISRIRPQAVAHGFLPYFADKELSTLWPDR